MKIITFSEIVVNRIMILLKVMLTLSWVHAVGIIADFVMKMMFDMSFLHRTPFRCPCTLTCLVYMFIDFKCPEYKLSIFYLHVYLCDINHWIMDPAVTEAQLTTPASSMNLVQNMHVSMSSCLELTS